MKRDADLAISERRNKFAHGVCVRLHLQLVVARRDLNDVVRRSVDRRWFRFGFEVESKLRGFASVFYWRPVPERSPEGQPGCGLF